MCPPVEAPVARLLLIFVLMLALGAGLCSCKLGEEPWPKPPPGAPKSVDRVIFVLLDAARADHFGTYGYGKNTTPEMDKIAQSGAVFTRHFAQSHATRNSMPQLMTGRYYSQGIISPLEEYPSKRLNYTFFARDKTQILLTDLLRKNGWKTACFSAHFGIDRASVLGRSFSELYDASKTLDESRPPARKVIPHAQRWITKNRDRKFFMYVHLMDTHFPHVLIEEHKEFVDPNYDSSKMFKSKKGKLKQRGKYPWDNNVYIGEVDDPGFYHHLNALYDGDLKHADKWVGKLWETVKELGIEDNTLLIITADHGEELGEHGYYGHVGKGPWDTIYHIPLMMVWSGRIPANRRVRAFTQHVDILPTLAELLGLSMPEGKIIDGKSMAPLLNDPNARIREFACGTRERGRFIRTDRWMAGVFRRWEKFLYDMRSDPSQMTNLADSKPEVLQELMEEVKNEVDGSYRRWQALPYTRPESSFRIHLNRMDSDDDVSVLKRGEKIRVSPGGWVKKGSYFIGRGGSSDPKTLKFKAEVPSALYTVDLECVSSPGIVAGETSAFMAEVGGLPSRSFSTAKSLSWYKKAFHSGMKKGWETVWLPIGVVEAKKGEITLRIKPASDPSKWVIVKSMKLTPVGGKKGGLSAGERKKLKALGYLE